MPAIDTDEYLRRFFDIEYDLPTPEIKAFCEYIFKRENLDGVQTDKEQDILWNYVMQVIENCSYGTIWLHSLSSTSTSIQRYKRIWIDISLPFTKDDLPEVRTI